MCHLCVDIIVDILEAFGAGQTCDAEQMFQYKTVIINNNKNNRN